MILCIGFALIYNEVIEGRMEKHGRCQKGEQMFINIVINSEDEIAVEEKDRNALCKAYNCAEKDLPTYLWDDRETIRKDGGKYV